MHCRKKLKHQEEFCLWKSLCGCRCRFSSLCPPSIMRLVVIDNWIHDNKHLHVLLLHGSICCMYVAVWEAGDQENALVLPY